MAPGAAHQLHAHQLHARPREAESLQEAVCYRHHLILPMIMLLDLSSQGKH